MKRLLARLNRPVDGASLGAFRIALGAFGALAAARFFTHGWIDEYYARPRYFFAYWGFSWVRPHAWMHLHYVVILVAALVVASGRFTRPACAVLAASFGYAHFCDQTHYLNHYYLFTLLAGLGVVLPWGARVPTWALWLVRFQLGLVYGFGALGKIGSDWLWHAQPLRIWLAANVEVLGPLARTPATAFAFSWGGFLFDLTIPLWLSWRRTRAVAYAAVIGFHVTTALLFQIGMFPWMMIAFTPIFFEPSWPRRFVRPKERPLRPLGAFGLGLLALYAAVQIALPLRSHLYPGNTLWSEEGFRFAWKVMLIEKTGVLELRVETPDGRRTFVDARDRLTPSQLRMVVTQPDMILQLAHLVAAEHPGARVYADSQVSFNGRGHARLIDPDVDLALQRDTLAHKAWILPAPP